MTVSDKYPLVSVVMSVYNGETYLHEAIDSVLNQTYSNFEFIIINDGSVDKSLSIIQSYNDKRIVLIDNDKNKGLIFSLNKGVEVAQGKYIARMDADDINLPNRLEKQVHYLESNLQIGVCGCNYFQFTEFKETYFIPTKQHDEIFSFMLFNSSIIHPSLLIRTSIIKSQKIIFDANYSHAEDYELWSRLIFICKFSAVNEPLFKYRVHKSQVTQLFNAEQIKSANSVRKNMLERSGFSFSQNDLSIHCKIGSSQLLKSFEELINAEFWLKSLLTQNKKMQLIDEKIFEKVIGKQWFDACGITNLGTKAFFYYFKSDLKYLHNGNHIKLLIKCVIRKFKK